jgi:ABC-type spermidine/putrescine transport system permease subunit II
MSYLTSSQRDRLIRIAGGSVLVFLWLPLVVMVVLSFGSGSYATFPLGQFTFKWYIAAFQDAELWSSILNTLIVATITAIIATTFGLLCAFALVRREFPLKASFRLLVIVPMIIPGVILGIALLTMFQLISGSLLSLTTVIIAHSIYTLPFALLVIVSRLYGFDETMEEAGRDLGASRLTVMRTVTVPQLSAAIGAGALLAFIRSFSEFIRAFFVTGSYPVFTVRLWTRLTTGLSPKINAISTIVMFGVIGLLLIAYYLTSGQLAERLYG